MSTEIQKKKPRAKTSTTRAASYLDRLAENNGKRVVVDLAADQVVQLEELIAGGFGGTAAAVAREAINQVHLQRSGGKRRVDDDLVSVSAMIASLQALDPALLVSLRPLPSDGRHRSILISWLVD
jgi:hypothetical protein